MPFSALVVRVLIASPGDTANARKALREILEDWNSLHAENDGVMALPVLWERDATPEMGERAQGIINRQLVDAADLLIGVFWTRLGTPTSEADSGTAEEIERCIEAGKPVLVYFSAEPVVPDSVNPEEYSRLASFRQGLKERGLIDEFSSLDELRRKATSALTKTIRERFAHVLDTDQLTADVPAERPTVPGAEPLARVDRDREVRGFSKSGTPQYRTRQRLVIENRGAAAAENLAVLSEVPEGVGGEPPQIGIDAPIRRLPAGGSIEYPLLSYMGMSPQWDIVFSWSEGDAQFTARQTMR